MQQLGPDVLPLIVERLQQSRTMRDADAQTHLRERLITHLRWRGDAGEEGAGHFWGILERRPYMRAREGLAHVLWHMGEHQTAIDHLKAMLRLNPGDNQGLRYVLAQWLLQAGEDEELGKLLEQYSDDAAANWAYTRALWLFRQQGATEPANAALADALSTNRFVPAFLLGRKRLPQRLPAYVGMGDENEAIEYAAHGSAGWRRISGALNWLTSRMESSGI